MPETLELNVKATIENISQVTGNIEDFLRRKGFTDETVFDVRLAVDEAITNVIQHGYDGKEGLIQIRCEVSIKEIVLVVEDSAKPFNLSSVEEPRFSDSLEKRQIGGLGVYLIKKKMDQVTHEFKNGKNILTMKKRVATDEAF
jgi:anti-sigma regulatory factor (Ser/Thr protein kinase)